MSKTIPKTRRCSPEMPNIHLIYRAAFIVSIGVLSEVSCQPENHALWSSSVQSVGMNAYQMVTGDDLDGDQGHWNEFYDTKSYVYGTEPAELLKKQSEWLTGGRALDLAMGEGRNAVFLARKGFAVEGVDISEVALRKAKRLAHEHRVSISTLIADLTNYKIKSDSYNLIINFYYLQRSLIPQIKRGLKRKGLVFYENHTIDQLSNRKDQNLRRDNLLNKGELRELFKDFEILVYQETNDGKEAKASLIARKP